ncbi:MAG: M16 family metallopeptidase [Victivallaceae bacterium]
MRRLLLLLSLFAAFAASAFELVQPPLPGDPFKVSIYKLDNGIKVYLSQNFTGTDVFVAIMFATGSMDDPSDKTGLAHYLEHLLFKGSEKLGTTDYAAEKPLLEQIEKLYTQREATGDEAERDRIYHEIDKLSSAAAKYAAPNDYAATMALLGVSDTNAFTSLNLTCYVDDVPVQNMERFLTVSADRFANPVLRGFHTELETVYEEYNMSQDHPERALNEFTMAHIAPGHPLGRPVIGTGADLRNPSPARVMAFYKKYYTTGNMNVVMVGAVEPETLLPMLENTLGALPAAPRQSTERTDLPPFAAPQEYSITLPIPSRIEMIWRLPGLSMREKGVADMLATALGDSNVGILTRNYVNPGLVASAEAGFFEMSPNNNFFFCELQPAEGRSLDETAKLLAEAIGKIKKGDFPAWLPEAASNQTLLSLLRAGESNASTARMIATSVAAEPWKDTVARLDMMKTITSKEISEFAEKYLNSNYLTIKVEFGSRQPAEKLAKPPLTPLEYVPGAESELHRKIAEMPAAKPVEKLPELDRDAPLSELSLANGRTVPLRIIRNTRNDYYFQLDVVFPANYLNDKYLPFATSCFDSAGAGTLSPEEFELDLFRLGGSATLYSGNNTVLRITGLSANFEPITKLVFAKLSEPKISAETVARKSHLVAESRKRNREAISAVLGALQNYALYGADSPNLAEPSGKELAAVKPEMLESKLACLWNLPYRMYFYGNLDAGKLASLLPEATMTAGAGKRLSMVKEQGPRVLVCKVPAVKQVMFMFMKRGPKFDPATLGIRKWLNEYYGAGMNSVAFRMLREGRSLGYNVFAYYTTPTPPQTEHCFMFFVSTQGDKLGEALNAVKTLGFPVEPEWMTKSKTGLIESLKSDRFEGLNLVSLSETYDTMGLPSDYYGQGLAQLESATPEEVEAFFRKYCEPFDCLLVVGVDPDLELLKKFGPVSVVTPDEIMVQ